MLEICISSSPMNRGSIHDVRVLAEHAFRCNMKINFIFVLKLTFNSNRAGLPDGYGQPLRPRERSSRELSHTKRRKIPYACSGDPAAGHDVGQVSWHGSRAGNDAY